MPISDNEIKSIKETLARLEAHIGTLEQTCERRFTSEWKFDADVRKNLSIHDGNITDIYERLINIELKFFPNLFKDIEKLEGVIGSKRDVAYNPLDHRPPGKPRPKKT